ncbi:MAG: hypothetical protein R2856_15750 [Caldilineaceae bacterium]
MGNLVRGDMGNSLRARTPAFGMVMERLPATLELTIMAMIFAIHALDSGRRDGGHARRGTTLVR